jgi:predicted nucleotidyltransferase component of viral defense system
VTASIFFLPHRVGLVRRYKNVEKDFWVCWTLDVLYHGIPPGSPRLLFKGGTSLSKAHGLIRRFPEDIDITVFREDLKQAASIEDMEKLSGKKRRAKLDAIRDACRAWVTGPLRESLAAHINAFVSKDVASNLLALGQTFIRASIYAGPRALPQ